MGQRSKEVWYQISHWVDLVETGAFRHEQYTRQLRSMGRQEDIRRRHEFELLQERFTVKVDEVYARLGTERSIQGCDDLVAILKRSGTAAVEQSNPDLRPALRE